MKKIMVILSVFVSFYLYGQVDYNTEIQTIFNNNCISCHDNGGSYYGGLDLSTYDDVMSGGESGDAIEPFDHVNSYLWQRVNNGEMPPGNNPDLSSEQVNLIGQWIDEGALESPSSMGELFFSEYIEGSSNNKALEIYNPTDAAVDLAGYEIWRISNGGDWAEGEGNAVDLSGNSVASGDVFVVCNSSIAEEYAGECDILGTTATYYNGDDAVGLAHNGVLIDAIGEEGDDPGTGWAVAGVNDATREHTLVRKSSITQGNTDWASSAGTDFCSSEWSVYDQNTFNYLGSHDPASGNIAPVASAGPDQTVSPGGAVQLDGSGSYDPECAELSYSWDAPQDIALDDPSSATPSFTAPSYSETTLLTFTLTVTDDQGNSDSDETLVTVLIDEGLTIAEVRAMELGVMVTVEGVVTTPNFQSNHTEYVIQDATAGLVVFGYGVTDVDLSVGDEISVTGVTEEYNGKFEVAITGSQDITVLGTADLPQPQIITVAQLNTNGEDYESELITILNAVIDDGEWPDEGSSANIDISDDGGVSVVIMRIDSDTEIDGSPDPGWPSHVTGVGGQYIVYQILPRFISDFAPAGDNQYPVADAGDDQLANPGDLVTLDGSSSYDSDGSVEGYLWTQTAGTAVTLSDTEPEDGIATFTAPSVDGNDVLTFSLSVEDDLGDTGTDLVSIVISGGETSIYDIQYATVQGENCFDSPLMGEVVVTSGVVTAVQNPGSYSNFYIQDFGYDSWSGAYVYDNTQSPSVGDEVTFASTVYEYYGFTELTNLIGFSVSSSGNAVTPKDITTGELADGCTFIGESLEGMLVRVTDVEVVAETDDNGQWYVDDGTGLCQIDDGMFDGAPPTPVAGNQYTAIIGVVDYSYDEYAILPRSGNDIQSEISVVDITVDHNDSWNMVSLPLHVDDAVQLSLFPTSVEGTLYGFNGSYYNESELVGGPGYWLFFDGAGSDVLSGTAVNSDTITLIPGWNMIGSITQEISVDAISDPNNVIVPGTIYGFDGSYNNATMITPGKGYWINASSAGDITLSSGNAKIRSDQMSSLSEANIISFNGSELYFGVPISDEQRSSYSLPPKPPIGAFDARFSNGLKVMENTGSIELMNNSDLLTIHYQITGGKETKAQRWLLSANDGSIYELKGSGEIVVNDGSVAGFMLTKLEEIIPAEFSLAQNYPNPFNPVTNIGFTLPEEMFVTVSIYNLVGQKIIDLVRDVRSKGYQEILWDSKDVNDNLVPSGVYFYTITAGDYTAFKKMVLMK